MINEVVCGRCGTIYSIAAAQPEEPERVPEDSPDSVPRELDELKARGFKRVNRTAQPEEKQNE